MIAGSGGKAAEVWVEGAIESAWGWSWDRLVNGEGDDSAAMGVRKEEAGSVKSAEDAGPGGAAIAGVMEQDCVFGGRAGLG